MRAVYMAFIIFLFILTLPVLAVISFAIAVSSGLPIFFCQKRAGYQGRPFVMYKFRTMVREAESLKSRYAHMNEASGPAFKIRNDPRFTPIGRFLSHTGLDELPQLWNVLRGEMALIGPRPLPISEADKLKPWMRKRYDVLPGIISPWILDGYHKRTFTEWMRSDLQYAREKSWKTDFRLAVRTVRLIASLVRYEIRPIEINDKLNTT